MDQLETPDMPAERGVARYQRLASLMRHRIASGAYSVGERLPAITRLARELGVAVVTVRQAYEVLSSEGLITSRRGRGTHVSAVPTTINGNLRRDINDPLQNSSGISFLVLSTTRDVDLPNELRVDHAAADRFTCVKKVHTLGGEPFCYVEIYIPSVEFARFPKRVSERRKLASVVVDLLGDRCHLIRQRTIVAPADFPLCELLKIPFASPVARVARQIVDAAGNVLYGGLSWYRGDRYVSETEFPVSYLKSHSGLGEPKSRSRNVVGNGP